MHVHCMHPKQKLYCMHPKQKLYCMCVRRALHMQKLYCMCVRRALHMQKLYSICVRRASHVAKVELSSTSATGTLRLHATGIFLSQLSQIESQKFYCESAFIQKNAPHLTPLETLSSLSSLFIMWWYIHAPLVLPVSEEVRALPSHSLRVC